MHWCLAELASVAALAGDQEAAVGWLERADARAGEANRYFDPWVELDKAWVAAAAGELTRAIALATRAADMRMSRSPWNFGGGLAGDQAASSLVGVTSVTVASRAARRVSRCRWPLTRRNCLAASPIPAAIQRNTICPSCQRLTLAA
jgi:hypothetical protein